MAKELSRLNQIIADCVELESYEYKINVDIRLSSLVKKFEKDGLSPIEVLMGIVFDSFMRRIVYRNQLRVQKQVNVGPYTADFIISVEDETSTLPKIDFECDGHDFHERTKEQAEHDKKRDRYFQQNGYIVFRYTGREIWRDPESCATEAFEHLRLLEHKECARITSGLTNGVVEGLTSSETDK